MRTALLTACLLLTAGLTAADGPDPAAWRKEVMANPWLHKSSGEGFCWHFANKGHTFVEGYHAFGDPAWLAVAAEHLDWGIERTVIEDPDGFPGTFGGPFDNNKPGAAPVVHDTVVGDGLLCEMLAAFAETVLADQALEARFGDKAREYVDLVARMCYDKLEHRGMYYKDRLGYGSYHTYGKGIDTKSGEWVSYGGIISDNLNKHYTNGKALLRLWRITGEDKYKQRVVEIYSRHKAMRRYFPDEDRVVWNFWMPHGPYDITGNAPQSWVAVHPERAGYQAGETSDFVEVYDSGLVFDQRDIELMVATNKWMKAHDWRSADGSTKAGTFWSSLARFDDELYQHRQQQVAKAKGIDGQITKANFAKLERGFERRKVPAGHEVEVSEVPLQPGRHIGMAMVIPDTMEYKADKRVRLTTMLVGEGPLKLELLSADGNRVLGTIAETTITKADNYFSPLWDGVNPATGTHEDGKYLVRWTFNGEQRTWPVWVEPGEAPKPGETQDVIAQGETISIDFEGPLDERWNLGNKSEVSGEQVHGGGKALKVADGAQFAFGQYDDLPVTITAWLYDPGHKQGKKGGNGPGIGVRTANGDNFVVRQAWRPYLGGDHNYSWFNTGENKWFTPHPTNLTRATGWQRWILTFDGEGVTITLDGQKLDPGKLEPAKYVPGGGAQLVFVGGTGGPLYVDDIEITLP